MEIYSRGERSVGAIMDPCVRFELWGNVFVFVMTVGEAPHVRVGEYSVLMKETKAIQA